MGDEASEAPEVVVLTREQVRQIDPAVHEKFSPNLHAWVKRWFKKSSEQEPIDAFRTASDGFEYVGYLFDGDVIGSCVRDILHRDHGKAEIYSCAFRLERYPDFWPRYLKVGRCALDPDHRQSFLNAKGRYLLEGEDARVCTWCGYRQRRETIVVQKTYKRWVEAR